MTMRVYDLSKKFGITNKELLALLRELGFELASHSAAVPPQAIELVEKKLAPKLQEAPNILQKTEQKPTVQPQPEKPVEAPKPEQPKPEIKPVVPTPEIKKPQEPKAPVKPGVTAPEIILAPMLVADFAAIARKPVTEVILTLLKQGTVAAKNQVISEKIVAQLARLYNLVVIEKAPTDSSSQQVTGQPLAALPAGNLVERLPVVVVIGHVDHGKTTLLDFIRKTRVAAREKGGITQHLGAYEVKTAQGNIVFLDTPGHEAFSMMRARGIKIADIAILVVAADDGVMPQTLEAIKRAQVVGLPLIVAINKVDKATPAQIETVKKQLTQHGLVPEDWGGQTVTVPISAKLGQGIDDLLDVVALQAQLLELQANTVVPARGYVLESKLEKGRGPVATVITQHGKLQIGDYFRAGIITGKVSSLVDSYGKRVTHVGPSMPVQVAGFDSLPHAGDPFEVITGAESKKMSNQKEEPAHSLFKTQSAASSTKNKVVTLIVKTDNASSREALIAAITKVSAASAKLEQPEVHILHAAIGNVNESDISLAANVGAVIYCLHVKTEQSAAALAQKERVDIKHFDIIYKLLEDLEERLRLGKAITYVSKKIGEAIVLKVFDIKDLGVIAGAQVKSGRFTRDGYVHIWRGKQKIGEGAIKSLQRDRKSVKEVHTGFECAFLIDHVTDWQVDDRVECFIQVAA